MCIFPWEFSHENFPTASSYICIQSKRKGWEFCTTITVHANSYLYVLMKCNLHLKSKGRGLQDYIYFWLVWIYDLLGNIYINVICWPCAWWWLFLLSISLACYVRILKMDHLFYFMWLKHLWWGASFILACPFSDVSSKCFLAQLEM